MSQKPFLINSHTHVFTGDYVPPFLAKSFLPAPFYRLIHLPTVLWLFKAILDRSAKIKYNPNSLYNRIGRLTTSFKILLRDNFVIKIIWYAIGLWLTVIALFTLFLWLSAIVSPEENIIYNKLNQAHEFLIQKQLLFTMPIWLQWGIVLFVIVFFKTGRNFIFFIFSHLWKFLKLLPGKKTTELMERYVLMGRFSIYKTQRGIKDKLTAQYPPGSGFVILPMDMHYMGAGKLSAKGDFRKQMMELKEMRDIDKNNRLFPFFFIDPRRMAEEGDNFFAYTHDQGKVKLSEACMVNEYMERYNFSGFKIYPALGYYPFEEELLPLWKYAADNQIPIMTHCIKGVIFYRGKKEKAWDSHPVFKEARGGGEYKPLTLPERANADFSGNFTHPLNYLCLLAEPLLRILVGKSSEKVKALFGYNGDDTPLLYNLNHLKICFAHFGGEDEWHKYLEADRYAYAQRLIRERDLGINFSLKPNQKPTWGILERLWKHVDWYSLICSMMVQFPNVYSDISYILCKDEIFPLLKETLNQSLNPKLRERVLFGSDFYVVRNHNSDKELVVDTMGHLSELEFDLIARENPRRFLNLA